MTWTLVQQSAAEAAAVGTSIAPTLPVNSTAGNLLTVTLMSSGGTFTLPAGWVQRTVIVNSGNTRTEIWDYIGNPGGLGAAGITCTVAVSASLKGESAEFHTDVASPTVTASATGTGVAARVKTCPVATGQATVAGDLIVGAWHERFATAAAITWTTPAGFTALRNDTASDTHHHSGWYNLSGAGGILTVTGGSNTAADNSYGWTGALVSYTATPGGSGTPGLVGAFVAPGAFGTGVTVQQALSLFMSLTGRPLPVRRVYFGNIPGVITSDLTVDQAAGRKVCMSFRPAFNPPTAADAIALETFLNSCKNAGLIADVSLYPEAITQNSGDPTFTQALAIAAWRFYAPTVRQFYPAVFNTGSYGVNHKNENAWYPGDAYIDKITTDFYCHSCYPCVSTSPADTLALAASLADNASPPKPFGIWELNSSTVYQTQAQAACYFAQIQAFFLARLAAGKTNADLLLFSSNGGTAVLNNAITSASDYRIPYFDNLFDALSGGSGAPLNMYAAQSLGLTQTAALSPAMAAAQSLGLTQTALLASSAPASGCGYPALYAATYAGPCAAPPAPTWPQTILDLRCALLLGGAWTDISEDAYQRNLVVISRGRPDESSACNPAKADFELNNADGRYSPRNPAGPYYGLLGRNTPVRWSVPGSGVALRMEDNSLDTSAAKVTTPSAAGLNITGPIDIRIDLALSGWTPCVLAAKWTTAGNQRSWALVLNADGTPALWWSTNGTSGTTVIATGSPAAPVPLGRSMLRATLDTAAGTVQFFTAATMAGAQTLLSTVAGSGATSIFSGTAELGIGRAGGVSIDNPLYYSPNGRFYEFRLYSGIGKTLRASPVFTAQKAGASTFTDAQNNVWTLNGAAEISGRSYRGHFEMSSMPQQWDVTGTDVWTPAQAAGLLRRVSAGTTALPSAMRRAVLARAGTLAPVAYWPGEDAAGATSLAPGLPGGPPMFVVSGALPSFAAASPFLCSGPLPAVGNSSWTALVPSYPVHTANVLRFLLAIPAAGLPDGANIVSMHTQLTDGASVTGASALIYTTASGGTLSLSTALGAGPAGSGPPGSYGIEGLNGAGVIVSMELVNSGPNAAVTLSLLTPGSLTAVAATVTLGPASIRHVTSIQVNPFAVALGALGIGHMLLQSALEPLANLAQPLNAWQGETAGNRFARLCAENALPCRIYGYPAVSVAMGPQTPDTLANLLQSCEDADRGQIYEPRQALALGYRTQASMLNQAPAVTLDYSLATIGDGSGSALIPVDDDQLSRNDITITRGAAGFTGSSAQAVLNDGSAMSVSPPPIGIGDYPEAKTQNLGADSQLPDAAGWRLHLGTCGEERYPVVPLNLARAELAALMFALQEVNAGDYFAISNPPSWLPPGTIRQLHYGASEKLGGFSWSMSWNNVPESPYETGIFDDAAYGRADTDGSALAAAVSTAATSLSINVTGPSGILWTVLASDWPFNVIMGGEVMTVTAVAGSSSPQTFTVTRSVNGVVKAHAAGEDIRLYPAPVFAML